MRTSTFTGVLLAGRLRNIGLVLILVISMAVFFFSVADGGKNQSEIGNYKYWLPVISAILMVAFARLPLGNMLEKIGNGQLATYFMVGPFKLNFEFYEEAWSAKIEQDETKYYLVAIEHSKGKLIVEKFPTLDRATEYLRIVDQLLEGEKE